MAIIERIITAPRLHLQLRQRREVQRRQKPSRLDIISNDEHKKDLPKTERGWQKLIDFFDTGVANCKEEKEELLRQLQTMEERERIHEKRAVRVRHLYGEWQKKQGITGDAGKPAAKQPNRAADTRHVKHTPKYTPKPVPKKHLPTLTLSRDKDKG